MANSLFSKGREGILDRTIDMTGDVRVMLVKSTYVFDDTDSFVAELGPVDNGRSAALSGKSYSGGVFDAANASIIALEAVECSALIIFQHTGDDATSRLIAYIDSTTSGLPCTPGAEQTINVKWDNGANKIFKL